MHAHPPTLNAVVCGIDETQRTREGLDRELVLARGESEPTEVGLRNGELCFNLYVFRDFVRGLEDRDGLGELAEREIVLAKSLGDQRVQVESCGVLRPLLAEALERESRRMEYGGRGRRRGCEELVCRQSEREVGLKLYRKITRSVTYGHHLIYTGH